MKSVQINMLRTAGAKMRGSVVSHINELDLAEIQKRRATKVIVGVDMAATAQNEPTDEKPIVPND